MEFLKRQCWLMLLLGVFYPLSLHAADALLLGERQIKAGLLYNFLKYTEWPESSFAQSSALSVCIFGADPFEGGLNPMEGHTVRQRGIALRQLHKVADIEGCHLLFINAAEKDKWPEIRTFAEGKPILTISDFASFAASGGMIEFGRRDNHIKATLNMNATVAARLVVEERLLKLVTVMQEDGQ